MRETTLKSSEISFRNTSFRLEEFKTPSDKWLHLSLGAFLSLSAKPQTEGGKCSLSRCFLNKDRANNDDFGRGIVFGVEL